MRNAVPSSAQEEKLGVHPVQHFSACAGHHEPASMQPFALNEGMVLAQPAIALCTQSHRKSTAESQFMQTLQTGGSVHRPSPAKGGRRGRSECLC